MDAYGPANLWQYICLNGKNMLNLYTSRGLKICLRLDHGCLSQAHVHTDLAKTIHKFWYFIHYTRVQYKT